MRERTRRIVWLLLGAGIVALLGSASLAQERLPGVVREGQYENGTLGTTVPAAPAPAEPGALYTVSAWPTYTPPLADGPGRDETQSFCGICHSTTYITMQPPLAPETWAAEVTKMIKTFGAPIPEPTARSIVTYLQAHYATGTRRP